MLPGEKRKSHISNVLLIGCVLISGVAAVGNVIRNAPNQDLVSEISPGIVLLFFYGLFLVSKYKSSTTSSFILIFVLTVSAYYLAYQWSTTIPQSRLLIALTIIMGGILISSRFVFWLTLLHSTVFLTLTLLQIRDIVPYKRWETTPELGSTSVVLVILVIIGLISWLSNREIEKALNRARKSEDNLRKERDMLEIKVEERTRQIRNERMKQIMVLYRFADFGKLAAGLFHDLVDPLSVISLNLENINHETRRKKLSTEGKANIRSALKMVTENQRRVEAYVNSTRRQLLGMQIRTRFNLKAEIDGVIVDLTPKANTSRVSLEFHCLKPLFTFGNPVRFHQLMHNLISNAIDSYDGVKRRKNRIVLMKLEQKEKQSICSVEDFGRGISTKHLSQIFTPFFTTKPLDKGIGIGLSIAKEIVERDFRGEISVKSRIHKETLFTVQFPLVS